MRDVMVDIETLGTRPGDIILSIGAATFNRSTGEIGREFYAEIDPRASARMGMTVTVDTVLWWMEQSAEARRVISTASSRPGEVALDFIRWSSEVRIGDCNVWTQGDMDLPMLAAFLGKYAQPVPWKFWSYRDTRTAYDVARFDAKAVARDGIYHNALDDVRHQIYCLTSAINH